jgi:hypothetical protein
VTPGFFAALALLAGTAGCSTAAVTTAMPADTAVMPPDPHGLPTVFGPLSGSGTKAFTVTVRKEMAIELSCLGKSNDLAWVRSPIGGFAVVCGSPGNETFGGGYDSARGLERDGVRQGQRVSVHVTAPAGDTWQVLIMGEPA